MNDSEPEEKVHSKKVWQRVVGWGHYRMVLLESTMDESG